MIPQPISNTEPSNTSAQVPSLDSQPSGFDSIVLKNHASVSNQRTDSGTVSVLQKEHQSTKSSSKSSGGMSKTSADAKSSVKSAALNKSTDVSLKSERRSANESQSARSPASLYRIDSSIMSFLVSTIFHLALLLALAGIWAAGRGLGLNGNSEFLTLTPDDEHIDTTAIVDLASSGDSLPTETDHQDQTSDATAEMQTQSISDAINIESIAEQLLSPENFGKYAVKVQDNIESMRKAGDYSSPVFIGTSLANRHPGSRSQIALQYGGSLQSEQAVENALEWLSAHQYTDGGWSMNLADPGSQPAIRPPCPCNGRCSHGGIYMLGLNRHAATGLALLAYLGAGYTHKEGKYKDEVYRGLAFLLSTQRDSAKDETDVRATGQYSASLNDGMMYEQGIASLAVAEAYLMTKDPWLRQSTQRSLDFALSSQHYDGSWGYQPRSSGDLSIAGWFMMALRSGNAAELKVDRGRMRRIDNFLDSQTADSGVSYGYRGTSATFSMTAIGHLLRYYRGRSITEPQMLKGVKLIAENRPSPDDIYLDYYATQLLFLSKSVYWDNWNKAMRDYLVNTQVQNTDSHEFGSWYFDTKDLHNAAVNETGGRVYCTAMSAMILEVYYRYMPTYQEEIEERFEF